VLIPPTLRRPGTTLFPALRLPSQQEKLEQQLSAAAYVNTTATDRLFITNKTRTRRFLIDTGSDLCVYPRKFIPQRRSRVNYILCVANGTLIPTYGWLSLSLNLGLRRDFMRHNTIHHIWTTPGPPVTCWPRRLAPNGFKIAKAEFDAMVRDGTARPSESKIWPCVLWDSHLRKAALTRPTSNRKLQTHTLVREGGVSHQ
jgi:hypothetical protein